MWRNGTPRGNKVLVRCAPPARLLLRGPRSLDLSSGALLTDDRAVLSRAVFRLTMLLHRPVQQNTIVRPPRASVLTLLLRPAELPTARYDGGRANRLYHVHAAFCSLCPRRRVTSLVPSVWHPVTVRRGVAPVRLFRTSCILTRCALNDHWLPVGVS